MRCDSGALLVLDAGTGIRRLGAALGENGLANRIDILLTHLHMDHIQGLGFFTPLYDAEMEIHIWGPASTARPLRQRLSRYLSPPLFPVHLRSLPSRILLHDVPREDLTVGNFHVTSAFVCHPGATVGFRIESPDGVIAYLPDHEPALGVKNFPENPEWTSGYSLARDADILIHDAQYTAKEYASHVGWGHSSIDQVLAFAEMAGAKHVVLFHHDPVREDTELEQILAEALAKRDGSAVTVSVAAEERSYRLENRKLTVEPIPTPT